MKTLYLSILLAVAGLGFIAYPFFISSGDIDLQIKPAGVIMPAAYKVYANPGVMGGRYNLFKAIIKNSGNAEIKNLKVQYRIQGLIDQWTDVPSSTNLLSGQTAVVTCFPEFPQSITEKNTSSKEKADIKITYGSKANPIERDESFTFDMTSVNDIVFSGMADQDKAFAGDGGENSILYACMVSSEDPIIKHYAAAVQDKILCGESGAGVGGNGQLTDSDLKEKIRVMEGVYNATLLSHMVYSETQSGETKYNDNTSESEHIRLPREVVSGNTGLCIELALLHASVYKAAGLHPVVFLIPGHAYPGIKLGNQYLAMESTGIGGEGLGGKMSADQAFQRGNEELKTFFEEARKGNPMYRMLDIDDLYSQGFKDMELKADPIQAEEADKITQAWPTCLISAMSAATPPPAPVPANNTARPVRNTNRPSVSHTSRWMNYSINGMSFKYPLGWQVINHPLQQLPGLLSVIVAPNRTAQIESYHISNAGSPEEAMSYIRSVINSMGENAQYSQAAPINGLTRFNGTTSSNQGTLRWVGFFRSAGNGVDGIIIGSPGGSNNAEMEQIFSSIR
jgi:hypothetical protein